MSKSPAYRISGRQSSAGQFRRRWAVAVATFCISIPVLFAHPEIEEQLARATAEIARSPGSAELHLKRGQLFRVHRDWEKALGDFRQAAKLDPQLHLVERAIGRVYLDADQPEQALPPLERFLDRQPGDPEGLILRGRCFAKMGQPLKAATDFDAALPKLRRPTPELVIERARILMDGGEQFRPRALAGLAEGIEKLGDLFTLHRYAAELEIAAGQSQAALQRAHRLVVSSNGHLNWRILEAELLASLGNIEEARAAYRQALEAIASLPPHRRKTQTVSKAEESVRTALAKLAAIPIQQGTDK